VLGVPRAAQGANAALLKNHPGDLGSVDAVTPVQME